MLGFILNFPYTIIGFFIGFVCFPKKVQWHKEQHVILIHVTSFWWVVGFMKGMRAMAIGHVILLGKNLEYHDLEHELIHVRQYDQAPLIFPLLYWIELARKGYRENRYENEAYRIAGNMYKEK